MIKLVKIVLLLTLFIQCNNANESNKNTSSSIDSTEACCKKDSTHMQNQISSQSDITCPHCGFKKTETLPTDVCVIKYTCQSCKKDIVPKAGDCCVYCSYGTHKCPSKQ